MRQSRVTIGLNFRPDGERAEGRIRTDDLLITNQLLYQLSYFSIAIISIGTLPRFDTRAKPTVHGSTISTRHRTKKIIK